MHGKHRHAGIQRGDIAVGHIHGHGAAAAGVHLAQFCDLPDHACLVKQFPHIGNGFGAGIGSAGFAPGAGIFAKADAVIDIGCIALFKYLGKVGVKRCRYVRAEAEGLLQAHPEGNVLSLAQVLQESIKGRGLHASHAVGADLLLIRQYAHRGVLRRLFQIQQRLQRRIGTDAVVMAVGADHAAVQADVTGVHRRHGLQLRGGEVILHNTVFFMQQPHHGHLHSVGVLFIADGTAAQQEVQRLAGDGLAQGLFVLLHAQMGQKVRDDQPGIAGIGPHGNLHRGAVFHRHHAMELQGNGDPLVLADPAVVMGLEIGQFTVLIERVGLEVQPWRVDVGRSDLRTLRQGLLPDVGQQDTFAPVAHIHPVSRLYFHAPDIGPVPLLLRHTDRFSGAEPLRLGPVQEVLIAGAVCLHGVLIHRLVIAVLPVGEQLLLPFFHFIRHVFIPPWEIGADRPPIYFSAPCCFSSRI